MEVANVLIVPLSMIAITLMIGSRLGWLSYFAMLPMCGLLLVGGLYWRGKMKQLGGQKGALRSILSVADRLDIPLALSSAMALLLAIVSWLHPMLSVSFADRVSATIAATLAVLEYINYYHRQLQHFDHSADFKRLISGDGFRPAQMVVDLARYRTNNIAP